VLSVYVYEIQLESTSQGNGLGKFLMQLIQPRKVIYLLKQLHSEYYVKIEAVMAALLIYACFFLPDCNFDDILA
jgi:hypothetical protein